MDKELEKVKKNVLAAEKELPAFIPDRCGFVKMGSIKSGFKYIAIVPDGYPLIWDGDNWELPSPLVMNMIYKALEIASQKSK